jgi:putative peptidoglycan lipid II flippase
MAIYLGSGPLADAFFVAFRIPNTFRRLFSEGTFNAAFVPSYSSELAKSKNKANEFANIVFNLLLFGLLLTTILIEIFMPVFIKLIAPGFTNDLEQTQLAINLTRLTFPFLFFISLASFLSAILNSHNKFAAAAAAPIILNILLILCLILANQFEDNLVYYLSYTVSVAGLIQFVFLLIFVRKFYFPKIDLNFKIHENVKTFFKKLLPSIFASGVTQINILVGTIIASFQVSAVSYLYYADRIYQINLAIAGIAIGTVILPNLSKYVETKNDEKILQIQNKALELSLFLSLPAAFALIVASEEITSSLFGYGSFDKESVKNSASALFYFSIGLPAFSLIKIFSSFLFARKDTNTPFKISLFSVITNILISVIFFKDFGFIIIPIATSISSWLNGIILMIVVIHKKYFKFSKIFFHSLFKILFSNLLTISVFYYLIGFFSENFSYESNYKFLSIIVLVLFIFVLYILISIVTKAFKISDIKIKY